ncbi:hypothetical protein CBR_g54637 [Chara braunii]|uniref:DUF659 domain-containing protein n=1 Tax=Chara braunii TaxID=69332 RepID=A0A388MCJ1_CHABU|nr:hypothetical protein CBR_g54637 [Chara braunii]|eukprot:GBG92192.1 hypothetical protein CBR_g54637 [Chara braunii]
MPFNFIRLDKTKELHDVYMELAARNARMDLPAFETIRAVALNIVYDNVRAQVRPLMDKWDISGCTLITDGTQDRKSRAVLNFVAAGESGAVLIKVVDVSDGKKNARALAKLWEEVIREIGVHRVNAIYTDNASANKRAAKLLSMRTDKAIAKIPWIPCAAHTLSLLLKDISNIAWIKTVWKKGRNLVKFIKNHQSTMGLLSRCSMGDRKVLVMPTEVRFTSVYQMLIRIWDRRHVLKHMMDNGWLDIYWSSWKDREDAEDIFAHVRCDIRWQKVDTILSIMKPIYDLLRMMDSDGVALSQLWRFDDLLKNRMQTMSGVTSEQHHEIMKLVVDRCKMMRQPAHAANFLLSPARRDPRWLLNNLSPLVHNGLKFFLTQLGGNSWGDLDSHEEVWNSLWTFHCRPPKEKMKDEDLTNRFAVADASLERKTASQWWGLYESKHIELQKIAMRVTACGARQRHLLWVSRCTTDGFIDLWATFFDEPEAPLEANDAAKDRREVDKEEEAARVARPKKIPKGRLPAGLLSDDSGNSDNEDLAWCDKVDNRVHRARGGKGKGKAAVVEDEEDEWDDADDDDTDSDFEIRPHTGCTDSNTDGGRADLWDVPEATCHLYNDDDLIVEDSEARDRRVRAEAQSLADRDHVMVQQRMAKENSRRLAVPAHLRTVEGHVQQQAEQRPQEPVQQLVEQNPQRVVRQQQEQRPQQKQQKQHEVEPERQQVEQQLQQDMEREQQNVKQQQQQHNEEQQQLQNEEQHQQPSQQSGQEQHTGQQQQQTDQQQHLVEQQQQQPRDQQQQDVEQQQHDDEQQQQDVEQQQQQAEHHQQSQRDVEQQQQQQPRTTAAAATVTTTTDTAPEAVAGSSFYCPPPMPRLDEAMVHDNMDISRSGRKRKVPVEPAVAKRGRGRPRKGEGKSAAAVPVLPPMATAAGRPKRKQRKRVVVEDDPTGAEDSSDGQRESLSCTCLISIFFFFFFFRTLLLLLSYRLYGDYTAVVVS